MGYKHADLLNYAKSSNLIIAKGDNVKNAKKFSDLTPTKQRIVRESYKKFISKKKKSAPKPAPKPAEEGLTDLAKENIEDFKYKVGDRIAIITGKLDKARVVAGVIEGFSNKGVIMKRDEGEIIKQDSSKNVGSAFNPVVNKATSYFWKKKGDKTKKHVVAWGGGAKGTNLGRKTEEYNGKNVSVGRVGG